VISTFVFAFRKIKIKKKKIKRRAKIVLESKMTSIRFDAFYFTS